MKDYPLPPLTLGLDVLTPEGSLPKGAVRRASNVQLLDDGGFQLRPGYAPLATLAGAHSLWRSPAQTRVLVAAQDTLYAVDLAAGMVASLFVGLPLEQPVSYTDLGPDIYFAAAGVVRKITPAGLVRRPGVRDLFGMSPTLTATLGGLTAGRYGVAYALVNDLGEESGLSAIEWIELATSGGTLLAGLATADNVAAIRLYVTPPNGGELYHHDTRAYAATQTITDQTRQRLATRSGKRALPGGNIVRYWRGRLWVVDGNWIWVSDPLDYGVFDVKGGWLSFNRTITLFEPVEGGIFVGFRERTLFLRGTAPADLTQDDLAHRGALAQSGSSVAADLLGPELTPDRAHPCAVWLCDGGLAVGRPDGSVVYPQADRISLAGDGGRALFLRQNGIAQGIFCVDGMTTGAGGASDTTI